MVFPKWYKKAEELYVEQKLPYYKIAKETGVCRKTVSYYLRKGGHKSNPKYVRKVDPSKLRKHTINENIFSSIDTEEKAYWLGFLYADGYISKLNNVIEVSLCEKDLAHLKKLKRFLETSVDIHKRIKKDKNKEYIGYRLSVSSSKIKEDLESLGCTNAKSSTLKFPKESQVPKSLQVHFIRGYFDGDGCITVAGRTSPALEILGTKEFLEGILNFFNSSNTIHGFNHCHSVKRIQFFGEEANDILSKMYGNSNIYLDRKYELFKRYCSPS